MCDRDPDYEAHVLHDLGESDSDSDANPPSSSGLGTDMGLSHALLAEEAEKEEDAEFSEVKSFLEGLGLASRFAHHFKRQGVVNMHLLLQLEGNEMEKLGLGVGHIRVLQGAISTRKAEEHRASEASKVCPTTKLTQMCKVIWAVMVLLCMAWTIGSPIGEVTKNESCRVKLTPTMDDVNLLRSEGPEGRWSTEQTPSTDESEAWEPVDWNKAYLQACASGDVAMVKTCLEGESPKAVSNAVDVVSQQSCHHLAAKNGRDEIVSVLIKAPEAPALKAEVNARDREGYTPLQMAASHGHGNCLKPLLEGGAYLAAVDEHGRTLPHLAANHGHAHFIKAVMQVKPNLLQALDKEDMTVLHLAAGAGHRNTTEFLVQVGLRVDAVDRRGQTAMFHAVKGGHAETVAFLVAEASCATGLRDKHNKTALHRAVMLGNLGVAQALTAKDNVDLNAIDGEGNAAVHLAVAQGHLRMVDFLIFKGADLNAKDKSGYTPLLLAARFGHLEVLKSLWAREQCDRKASNSYGNMAIHVAVVNGKQLVVKYLIEEAAGGRDLLEARGQFGRTALHKAAAAGHTKIAKYLASKGSELNTKDTDNESTPLLLAASFGKLEVAKVLIEAGCDKAAKNKYGVTAVVRAKQRGHTAVAEYLKSQGCPERKPDKDGEGSR